MSHNLEHRCQRCCFWTGDPRDDNGQGECRRYPMHAGGVVPVQNQLTRQAQPMIIWGHPETKAGHWCGEFSPGQEILQ